MFGKKYKIIAGENEESTIVKEIKKAKPQKQEEEKKNESGSLADVLANCESDSSEDGVAFDEDEYEDHDDEMSEITHTISIDQTSVALEERDYYDTEALIS